MQGREGVCEDARVDARMGGCEGATGMQGCKGAVSKNSRMRGCVRGCERAG